jgi:O-antigen ligase
MKIRDWITVVAGTVAVAASIFLIGGVHRWAQAIVAVVAAVAMASIVLSRRGFARRSPLLLLLSVATALTALQLVPLPARLLQVLQPSPQALREDGADLLGVDPPNTLTSDVPGTLGALVFFITLLAIAIVAMRFAATERGRYRLVAGITLFCGVTAFIVGLHHLFGTDTLYGLYKPEYARPRMLGPLLNANSLACLMAMGTTLGIGLAAHQKQRGWLRVLWLLIVAGCGMITVATVSRGATLALVAGSVVTIGCLLGQRLAFFDNRSKHRRSRFLTNALPIGVIAGCVVGLVIYLNAGTVESQISQLSFDELHYSRSKFSAWQSSRELIAESPWFGVGRGAFEASFPRVHPASGLAIYAYLENEYLQAVVDWGIPGAVVLGVLAIWLAFVALRRWRDGAVTAGALGALAVVAIQSNVDFGLEFLGIAAPTTVIAACLAYVPLREVKRVQVARATRVVHAVALIVGATLLLSTITTTVGEDRATLAERPRFADIKEAASRHPLDYYPYAVAAELLERRDQPVSHVHAVRLLNQALTLHPTHPGLHRLAGQMLLRDGYPDQAAIEYAAALKMSPDPHKLIAEILEKFDTNRAVVALPLEVSDPQALVDVLTEMKRTDIARAWLARMLSLRPKVTRSCDILFRLAAHGDVEAAEIAAQHCRERLPDYQTRVGIAQLLMKSGRESEILALLHDIETWQSRREDKVAAWLLYCDAQFALGYIEESRRCLRRLDASPDMLADKRTELLRRLEIIQGALRTPAAPP